MALNFLMTAWAFAGLGAAATCLEKATIIPEGWQMLSEVPDPSTPMRISIAMRQPEIQELASKITSNTMLDKAQVAAMRAPAQKDVDDVMKWLADNGITKAQPENDWIHVQITVGEADRLLDTKLRRYSFGDQKPILRTTEYSVPDCLAEAINFIHPIANFMTPEHEVMTAPPLSEENPSLERRVPSCFPFTTPDCLKNLYGINYSPPGGTSDIRFGIAGFLEQWGNYHDLDVAFAQSRPDLLKAGYNFTVELINGGLNTQTPGTAGSEANLDLQFGMAVGYPTNVVYYSTGGRGVKLGDDGKPVTGELDDNEPYLEFIEYLLAKDDKDLPSVISISYADDEQSVPKVYALKICDLLGLLTGRGVSILSGSGDGGARGGRNATCRSNDKDQKEMTIATFPASCPWVTSVGAVTNHQDPPRGADFSSGGFSDFFKLPDWQRDAVNQHISELKGHLSGYYNPAMRAIPDISAVGTNFKTIINGQPAFLQGTSASTPVLAGMIALINDARVRQGKPLLGWLNGRLYSQKVRAVLQDITAGRSLSCVFSGGKQPGGWPATKGYDTITGLGVPNNFQTFMDVLVASN